MSKRFVIHPFVFAIFPILALLANNITEVAPRVALRSAVISLAACVVIFAIFLLIFRRIEKAGLFTSLLMVLFFSYGQVYELLQQHPVFGFSLGRHRYLVIIFGVILLAGFWVIFKLKETHTISKVLNILSLLLLIYPTFQVTSHILNTSRSEQRISALSPITNGLAGQTDTPLPDVYFIILDGYSRSDVLLDSYGIDNSGFLQSLRDIGFYVVDCSRANYPSTHSSVVTTLNMDYIPVLKEELAAQGLTNGSDLWTLIKQSKVRGMLESIGYKTVGFETGFEWSRLYDADVYLKHTGTPYEMQTMQPFEAMLIRSTALLIWSDTTYKSLPDYKHTLFGAINFPFEYHINQQLFILDQLPRLASFPGPKFVYAHLLISHYPFVFSANGDILTDPGYYSKDDQGPIDEQHFRDGYANAIEFTDSQLVNILNTLITDSNTPPIIVLMGDHGLGGGNRPFNLNAIYLPNTGSQVLYPNMTPVNTFRVIFDTYFGTNFGLLPDVSYEENGSEVNETYPGCIQK